MLAEEFRIAKSWVMTQGAASIAAVSGPSGLPMGASTIAIMLSVPPGSDVWFVNSIAAVVGTGWKVSGTQGAMLLTFREHGALVRSAPNAIATVACNVGWVAWTTQDGG